jgi:hypothetical protein
MTDIRTSSAVSELCLQLEKAHTWHEIDEIRDSNLELLSENPFLYRCLKSSRKRVEKLRRFKLQFTNKIYTN